MSNQKESQAQERVRLWERINPLKVNQLIAEMEDPVKGRKNDICNRCGFSFELGELFDAGEEGWLCEDCLVEREEEVELETLAREEKNSKFL